MREPLPSSAEALHRRHRFLRRAGVGAGLAVLALLAGWFTLATQRVSLNRGDILFLDEIERRALSYFVEHTDPFSGLTRDRAPTDGSPSRAPASVAASGFALTAWCIAAERGWMPRDEARQRTRTLLRFVERRTAQEHGWLYHFVDVHTGARYWKCEASTIDTALFLQGALLAREYLRDTEISALVERIYARIDWRWALNGGRTLSHGWRPETGFLASRWDSYSELPALYLLGMAAPSGALSRDNWDAWERGPVVHYAGRTFIQCPPLFTHQYPHAWFDLRRLHDEYADYWQNSVNATLAQRDWCAALSTTFGHWSKNLWGLSASDSAYGYVAWGGPVRSTERLDGTIVPCAPGGSLPFAPGECLGALRKMREVGGAGLWGRYGFADAFNPQTGWISPDVIAIDLGIVMAMAENLRSGFCWRVFMRAPEARRALQIAGFRRMPSGREFALRVPGRTPWAGAADHGASVCAVAENVGASVGDRWPASLPPPPPDTNSAIGLPRANDRRIVHVLTASRRPHI